jgi:hypothetical protein
MTYTELEPSVDDHLVFPGNPKSVYRYYLKKCFSSPAALERLLRKYNRTPQDLGTHSLRKGSTSAVHGGSAGGGPSAVAVCIRSEHSVGSVEGKYWRYEKAGDQHVGRTVAGLPVDRPEFASLPPHFVCANADDEQFIADAVRRYFVNYGQVPSATRTIMPVLLATVLYHLDDLRHNLPPLHPVRYTPLFGSTLADTSRLRGLIRFGLQPSPEMTATGVPPSVRLSLQVHGLQSQFVLQTRDLRSQVASATTRLERSLGREAIATVFRNVLAEAGVAGSSMTAPRLDAVLTTFRGELMGQLEAVSSEFTKAMDRLSATTAQQPSGVSTSDDPQAPAPPPPTPDRVPEHRWSDGRFRQLPEDWILPRCDLKTGWLLWNVGLPADRIPPLKRIDRTEDFSLPQQRKYYCDWKVIMQLLTTLAHEHCGEQWGQLIHSPTTQEALCAIYDSVIPHLGREETPRPPASRRKKRRQTTLTVLTATKHLRRRRRLARITPSPSPSTM